MNSILNKINNDVNALPYVSDPANFDDWTPIDEGGGDCDSYAVGKLRKLVALGWDIKALRLACCYTENNEYHAVLVVGDSDGDWMLDNRQPRPVPIKDLEILGYKPDRIQQEGGSRTWVKWLL